MDLNNIMNRLTKAEEEIMQVLWKLEKAYVREIIKELPLPHPAYNTVSTIVRILEKKGVIGHKSIGKSHQYFPLVEKETYRKKTIWRVYKKLFRQLLQITCFIFYKRGGSKFNRVGRYTKTHRKADRRKKK